MRAEIEDFRHSMKTIQAAKCSICHGQLDLPAGKYMMNVSCVRVRVCVVCMCACVFVLCEACLQHMPRPAGFARRQVVFVYECTLCVYGCVRMCIYVMVSCM